MPTNKRAETDAAPDALPPGSLSRLAAALLLFCAIAVGLRITLNPPIDAPSPDSAAVAPIDVNSATEQQLTALPRIGPALARRIVEDRAVSGEYSSLDDLDRVPGIGPRTIDALRPHAVALPPG